MGFMPTVGVVKEMDHRIFNQGKMGVKEEIQMFNNV